MNRLAQNAGGWVNRESTGPPYAQPLPAAQMRQRKAAEFERLRADYERMRDSQWNGDKRYDAWVYAPLNNARLLPFGQYHQRVPAFAALFKREGGIGLRFIAQWNRSAGCPPMNARPPWRHWLLPRLC